MPAAFAALRSEIERLLAELHMLDAGFRQKLQQSLTQTALAVEDQVQKVVAAEQAAQKASVAELRASTLRCHYYCYSVLQRLLETKQIAKVN